MPDDIGSNFGMEDTNLHIHGAGTLEEAKDAGKGGEGVVNRWMREIDLASREERDWRSDARLTVRRYRNSMGHDQRRRFNVLFSNTETIRAAIFNSSPVPDIRRRHGDDDPVGKEAAEILSRVIKTSMDSYDFDHVLELAVLDYLLPGRAVTRLRLFTEFGPPERERVPLRATMRDDGEFEFPPDVDEATIREDENGFFQDGEEFTPKTFEEVRAEPVMWEDFRRGPGKKWSEVPWVAFRLRMTKSDLSNNFGEAAANSVSLDTRVDETTVDGSENRGGGSRADDRDVFKRATVWEVWDKEKKRVLFIAPSKKNAPLKVDEDPLNLTDFFPIPPPLYSITTGNTLIPIDEYRMYRDQAQELDDITHRISKIIAGLKLRGIYDDTIGSFDQLFSEDDNAMIPSSNGGIALQSGGMDKAVWFMPIKDASDVLLQLYSNRNEVKATIFEETGMSDIIRGASKASETATAQNIKARFGGMRLDKRVREVARYARDVIKIKAELIAENFDKETLSVMANRPVPDEVFKLLRDDNIRSFRVDVETDSTIAGDIEKKQGEIERLLAGIVNFFAGIAPFVQGGIVPLESAKTMLLAAVRKSPLGREVEEAIQSIGQKQQGGGGGQPPPDPEQQKAQAEAQMKQQEMQAKQQMEGQRLQLEQQKVQQDAQLAQAKLEADIQLQREKNQGELELKREEMLLKQQTEIEKARIAATAKEREPEFAGAN